MRLLRALRTSTGTGPLICVEQCASLHRHSRLLYTTYEMKPLFTRRKRPRNSTTMLIIDAATDDDVTATIGDPPGPRNLPTTTLSVVSLSQNSSLANVLIRTTLKRTVGLIIQKSARTGWQKTKSPRQERHKDT